MKIVKLLNGAVKCVVDSMKDIAELIDSGKSKEINMLDLSKIGFVSNCYDSLHSRVFEKNNFPNLDYIHYNNPIGIIDRFAFANSTIQKADINCYTIYHYAFSNSYLEELDVKDTECVFTSAVFSTKVREIKVSPKICQLFFNDASVRVIFKERDAQDLPIANLRLVTMSNPESYLKKHGFNNFKDLLLYNPEIFLECKCNFTTSELQTVRKVADKWGQRKLQTIKLYEKENPEKAEAMAGHTANIIWDIYEKTVRQLQGNPIAQLRLMCEPVEVKPKEHTANSEGKDDK